MEKLSASIRKLSNPFKFLNAYQRDEDGIFEGRTSEIDLSYDIIRRNPMLLVFGEAGVGKTSLVQCGLANRFQRADWYEVLILRKDNINDSLRAALLAELDDVSLVKENADICELVEALYLDTFKPVFLIFDQLEELYVNGSREEILKFYQTIKDIIQHRNSICKFIFVIRDDFHAQLHDFETHVGSLFSVALQVKRMKTEDAVKAVHESLKEYEQFVDAEPNTGYISQVIAEACSSDGTVHLPKLQTLLYILWNKAPKHRGSGKAIFSEAFIKDIAKSENLLMDYVQESVVEVARDKEGAVWQMLGKFISAGTTKKSCQLTELLPGDSSEWNRIINDLQEKQILRKLDEDHVSLTHDSLIPAIKKNQPADSRPRLTEPVIQGNPYKGLTSYDEADNTLFFGRGWVISEFSCLLHDNKLLVVVGPSGSGKSSLIKAGLLPIYREQQFYIIAAKPGKDPTKIITNIEERLQQYPNDKLLIYIDQFEELSTQCESEELRDNFISFLKNLLENDSYSKEQLKILLSIRSDYEHEFDKSFKDWRKMKRTVPDFSAQDIRDIIIEPAYYAGLEFRPPYLVDNIVREVMQSNGSLPLLSYTLNQMYEEYRKSNSANFILSEDHYNKIGGVVDGLRSRANEIFENSDAEHKTTIRNVMLRMVSLGIGERAGKRVLENELIYKSDPENERVQHVLQQFEEKRLVNRGKDEKGSVFYEPAHDSLIRAWDLIEILIKRYGSEILYLQRNLSIAVTEYKKYKKLWHEDPRLDSLLKIMKSEDNWLNRDESEFVENSLKRRNSLIERGKRKQEEENQRKAEKAKILEHTLEKEKEKVVILNRSKRQFRFGLITMGVLTAVVLFLLYSSRKDEKRLEAAFHKADSLRIKENTASLELIKLNKLYLLQKDTAILNASEVASSSVKIARESEKSKQLSLKLAEQLEELKIVNEELETSNELITRQREDLNNALTNLQMAEQKRKEVESMSGLKATSAKWLQIAKSHEGSSPAFAYQIARRAMEIDSSSEDASAYFKSLQKREGYYESISLNEVESAIFSASGNYFRTITNKRKLSVYDLSGREVKTFTEDDDILYATFFPDDQSILVTTENGISIKNIFSDIKSRAVSVRNPILQSVISSDGKLIALVQNKKIRTYNNELEFINELNIPDNAGPVIDAAANNEFILLKTAMGVHLIPVESATRNVFIPAKQAYLFPNGNAFISFDEKRIEINYSRGTIIRNQPPGLPAEFKNLTAISFNKDNTRILLSFEADPGNPKQSVKQQQQQNITKGFNNSAPERSSYTYVYDVNNNRFQEIYSSGYSSLYTKSILSPDGNTILNCENGSVSIFPVSGAGSGYKFGGYNQYEYWGFHPADDKILLTKTVTNPQQKTGEVKIWVKGNAAALDQQKRLYAFSEDQFKRAGVE